MKKAIVAVFSAFLPGILSVYGLFRVVFCYPRRLRPTVRQIPDSDLYCAHRDKMLHVVKEMENAPCEEVYIASIEGLQLHGKLYYGKKDMPLLLFFMAITERRHGTGMAFSSCAGQMGTRFLWWMSVRMERVRER